MIRRPPRSTLFPYHDALPIYSGERGHGGAANADEVNPAAAHVFDLAAAGLVAAVADSRMVSSTLSDAVSLAFTPSGSVMLACDTWPERRPKASGIPRSLSARFTTSSSE